MSSISKSKIKLGFNIPDSINSGSGMLLCLAGIIFKVIIIIDLIKLDAIKEGLNFNPYKTVKSNFRFMSLSSYESTKQLQIKPFSLKFRIICAPNQDMDLHSGEYKRANELPTLHQSSGQNKSWESLDFWFLLLPSRQIKLRRSAWLNTEHRYIFDICKSPQ